MPLAVVSLGGGPLGRRHLAAATAAAAVIAGWRVASAAVAAADQ
jgi:hypothetical protein